jgi:hypothetical protein
MWSTSAEQDERMIPIFKDDPYDTLLGVHVLDASVAD